MVRRKSRISVQDYYDRFAEGERLAAGLGRLEFERTKSILERFLPPAPGVVIDVGGGTGPYSLWLAKLGYMAHLVELSPALVGQALQASRNQGDAPVASFTIGDARCLGFPNRSADAVLMFGPLYHLTEREERLRALREAYRMLKHKGLLFAAAISRFASLVEGMLTGSIRDPVFAQIVADDLADGEHCNPTDDISYFTDAFYHLPWELRQEVEEAGFGFVDLLPVEGMGALVGDLDALWQDEGLRLKLLEMISLSESEETILGVSPHLICIAQKNQ
jgi:ubiquinone/menaquinone biosynthesis C-methylase UbiE